MDGVKVLFFDMGNTLLHFHHGNTDNEKDELGLLYLTKYLKKYNENINFDDVKDVFFKRWMEGIEDRSETSIEYPIEDFLNVFLAKYNFNLDLNECIEAIHIFYTEYREQIYFEKDLYKSLKAIKEKGYKLGVISNTCYYDEVMKECFKKAKIYDLLDNFTFSYSLRIGKPKLQIFKTAIEAMNISPMESVMVGDNLATDIKPAIELGMKTIWLNNSKKTNNSNIIPNAESSSIAEILKYI